MMRWTTVSALLLLLGGATFGVWHLMVPGGPASSDDAVLASIEEAAERIASPEAALSLRIERERMEVKREDPGLKLVARWRSERERNRAQLSKRIRRLSRSNGWLQALERYMGLRVEGAHAENLANVSKILDGTTDPVARQNLIFLVVLTLPTEVSYPWLQALRTGEDPGDAEDALVALAFDGEATAAANFQALARTPSEAKVRRLMDTLGDHESLAGEGGKEVREILRSYRAIEVLDRRPYFKRTPSRLHKLWRKHATPPDGPTRRGLEEAWVSRYPGHPGSDDIAWRVGRGFTREGRHFEAAEWYSFASVQPDRDMSYPAVRDLIVTCELLLTPHEVWRIAAGPEEPNYDLLDYIATRRVAVSQGLQAALAHVRMRAETDPESVVGHAWNRRLARDASRGLDSGLRPLGKSDPLRRNRPAPKREPRRTTGESDIDTLGYASWKYSGLDPENTRRTQARLAALQPDSYYVAQQLRHWEALDELARRERDAEGVERADLIYKQAAIAYHEWAVLFPRWTYAGLSFGWELRNWRLRKEVPDKAAYDRARERFEQQSYAPYLAIRHFDRLEREHPEYPAMDKVLFSRGMAWKQLIDFRPYESDGSALPWATQEERMDHATRQLVVSFERLASLYPDSSLTDDALAAVAYWRKARPSAFGR